jgi:hypothetical protein
LFTPEGTGAVWVSQANTTGLCGSQGDLDSSADAICVNRKRPMAPGGTCGRSQNTKSTPLATVKSMPHVLGLRILSILASSALSRFFMVSRSWRCHTQRTPAVYSAAPIGAPAV